MLEERPYKCKSCGWGYIAPAGVKAKCRPCQISRTKQWKLDNPEKHRENERLRKKRYRQVKRDIVNAQRRRTKTPEKRAVTAKIRKDWINAGDVLRIQLIELYEAQGGNCQYCGAAVRAQFNPSKIVGFDHIIPRAKGGLHTISNLRVCCRMCNCIKSDNVLPDGSLDLTPYMPEKYN